MDKRGVVRLQRIGGVSQIMRRHTLKHDCGGDLKIYGVCQFEQVPAWRGIQFGVGAVAVRYAIGDAIADFDVFDFGTDFDGGSRCFGARNIRQRATMMAAPVKAGAIIDIEKINAGSFDLD